ncbi:MAG TPA: hypothetical protein PLU72_09260 [Candidatus Ozemobacteraceae bacterium]|nr:hypothetical protein [Candidatus Ozemobacteraceae bacterium]HQG28625.1 hypothetical protein [Candidatus Ozemobacteraceae bacterium]
MNDWWPAAARTKRAVAAAVVFAGLVILAPLTFMALASVLREPAGIGATACPPSWERLWPLAARSAGIAFGSATLAVLSGGGLAWTLLSRRDFLVRTRELLLLPLVVPPYLLTLGWVAASDAVAMRLSLTPGLSGPGWAVIILGLAAAPPVALVLEAVLRRNLAAPFESALAAFGPAGAVRVAVIPALRRPAAAVWLFVFGQTLAEYGVPLYLQTPVMATELVSSFTGGSPAGNVLLSSWPLALLVGCAAATWSAMIAREGASRRAGERPGRPLWLDSAVWPAWWRAGTATGCIIAMCGIAVPVAGLVMGALRAGGGAAMLAAALPAMRTSVAIAGGCALVALIPALVLGDALGAAAKRIPLMVSALALAIPAGCTGVAHAGFWNLSPFAGGETAIWCGHLARILPAAWLVASFMRTPAGFPPAGEAAMLLSGSAFRRSLLRMRLELPRVCAVAGVAFAVSIRELDVSLLTVPPGGETLPLRLFNLMHYGAGGDVCRLGLLLGLLLAVVTHAAAAFALPERKGSV